MGIVGSATRIALLFFALICNEAKADFAAGVAAYARGDYARAFSEFSIAANNNDGFAQNVLGTMYFQGQGVERNYKRALDWFFKAQALGSPEAMANLAAMYEAGLGVPQSDATALKYFREASLAGNPLAILRMAEIFERGELGVTPDAMEASRWRARLVREQAPVAGKPPPVAQSVATVERSGVPAATSAASRRTPSRDARPRPSVDKGALFEQQVLQSLEDYGHRQRKLFVASTDSSAALSAYLKELRAQLSRRLGNAFSAAGPEEKMIVTLSILRDGTLKDVELSRGAGNPKTNTRVLSSLKKLAHLQPLPTDVGKLADVLVVTVALPIE